MNWKNNPDSGAFVRWHAADAGSSAMRHLINRQALAPGGFAVGVVGGAQDGDEDGCLADFTGHRIDDRHGRAGVVDEQLLARSTEHGSYAGLPRAGRTTLAAAGSGQVTPANWHDGGFRPPLSARR